MPAKRAHGDQEFYPWSAIVTRSILRWPDNARVALAVIVNLETLPRNPGLFADSHGRHR